MLIPIKSTRLFMAAWFALIGYTFVRACFIDSGFSIMLLSLSFAIVCGYAGFKWGYKSLEQPVTEPNRLAVHLTAGIWTAILFNPFFLPSGGFIWEVIFNSGLLKNSVSSSLITTIINLFLFVIGWKFTYKLLLWPNIKYQVLYPSNKERIFASVWFGATAFLLSMPLMSETILEFLVVLTSYLGFVYGSRILIQPSSLKGVARVAIDGLIGATYTLAIFTILGTIKRWDPVSVTAINQAMSAVAILSLMFCLLVIGVSLLLYLLSRIPRMISHWV